MIELTINLIHKFELILFMAVDFIDETIFKTHFFRKIGIRRKEKQSST